MRHTLVVTSLMAVLTGTTVLAGHWPQWRGPSEDGVSTETGLPTSWSATCADPQTAQPHQAPGSRPSGGGAGAREGRPLTPVICSSIETENVSWKIPLPAYSGSTPIVWGDTIFLNVATGANTGALELWAVDRTARSVAWKRRLVDANHMERKQNMSSPSPVTDGRHVWVMTGLGILKAFDFSGQEIWSRDLQADYGKFGLNWGYASSPCCATRVRPGAARHEDG